MDSILKFWFPDNNYQKWWFKSTEELDKSIYDRYYQLFNDTIDNFNIMDYYEVDPEIIISTIILLDQFSRNMARIDKNIKIKKATELARELTTIWIIDYHYMKQPIHYTVFAFMPIRHLKDIEQIKNMLTMLEYMESSNSEIRENIIFTKFKETSVRNFIALKLSNP